MKVGCFAFLSYYLLFTLVPANGGHQERKKCMLWGLWGNQEGKSFVNCSGVRLENSKVLLVDYLIICNCLSCRKRDNNFNNDQLCPCIRLVEKQTISIPSLCGATKQVPLVFLLSFSFPLPNFFLSFFLSSSLFQVHFIRRIQDRLDPIFPSHPRMNPPRVFAKKKTQGRKEEREQKCRFSLSV